MKRIIIGIVLWGAASIGQATGAPHFGTGFVFWGTITDLDGMTDEVHRAIYSTFVDHSAMLAVDCPGSAEPDNIALWIRETPKPTFGSNFHLKGVTKRKYKSKISVRIDDEMPFHVKAVLWKSVHGNMPRLEWRINPSDRLLRASRILIRVDLHEGGFRDIRFSLDGFAETWKMHCTH